MILTCKKFQPPSSLSHTRPMERHAGIPMLVVKHLTKLNLLARATSEFRVSPSTGWNTHSIVHVGSRNFMTMNTAIINEKKD
jgi:hypothetical protein